jgi:hypothetical protein
LRPESRLRSAIANVAVTEPGGTGHAAGPIDRRNSVTIGASVSRCARFRRSVDRHILQLFQTPAAVRYEKWRRAAGFSEERVEGRMHFDKKLGLAMGVLLVGIVGAIFFRNEPNLSGDVPRLENPRKIDERIAEKPLIPYLTGVETDEEAPQARNDAAAAPASAAAQWEVPPFLREGAPDDPLAANSPAPPDPIRLDPETESMIAIPEHNRAWQAQPARGVAMPASQRQVVHRVQSGETLSGLAAKYLGDAGRFEEIYAVNRDILQSPNDLRPGMMLKIPPKEGSQPEPETLDRGAESPVGNDTARGATPARNVSTLKSLVPPVGGPPSGAAAVENGPKSAPSKFVPFPRSPLVPRSAKQ